MSGGEYLALTIVVAAYFFWAGYLLGQTRERVKTWGTDDVCPLIDEGRRRYIAVHGPLAPPPKNEREYLRYLIRKVRD